MGPRNQQHKIDGYIHSQIERASDSELPDRGNRGWRGKLAIYALVGDSCSPSRNNLCKATCTTQATDAEPLVTIGGHHPVVRVAEPLRRQWISGRLLGGLKHCKQMRPRVAPSIARPSQTSWDSHFEASHDSARSRRYRMRAANMRI